MQRITTSALAGVSGGDDCTTATAEFPFCKLQTTTSDYKTCIDRVQQATNAQYPSTASWWNPFSRDSNAAPRATALMQNMRQTCGTPH